MIMMFPCQEFGALLFTATLTSICVDSVRLFNFKQERLLDDVNTRRDDNPKSNQSDSVRRDNSAHVWISRFEVEKRPSRVSIFIHTNSSKYACDSKFLSLTLDSNLLRWKFKGFHFQSNWLKTLAHGMSPCDVRVGGTYADFMTFDPDGDSGQNEKNDGQYTSSSLDINLMNDHLRDGKGKDIANFTVSGKLWKEMLDFFHGVGWDLMFDFNLFRWNSSGLWDPSNAQLLLEYTNALGYNIPAFQLGNEPNSFFYNFNFSIKPSVLVKDFVILKKLISTFHRYKDSQLFGPDVTDLRRHSSSRNYLKGFLQAGGGDLVSEISLHQYYMNGQTAKVEDFVNITLLDKLKKEIEIGLEMSGPLHIRFTETSSCFGGGAPGLSDSYVAGFLWLDKLGLSAQYGVTKVFRQTFYGGSYALLDQDNEPNPDYFLSLLHKRLIVGPVFNVTTEPDNKNLRIYAHCTRTDVYTSFPKGSVTLSYLNVGESDLTVTLSPFHGKASYLFILTPGDNNGLKSRFVKLNGRLCVFTGGKLPALKPAIHEGDVTLPALTYGFIVIPDADVSICRKSH